MKGTTKEPKWIKVAYKISDVITLCIGSVMLIISFIAGVYPFIAEKKPVEYGIKYEQECSKWDWQGKCLEYELVEKTDYDNPIKWETYKDKGWPINLSIAIPNQILGGFLSFYSLRKYTKIRLLKVQNKYNIEKIKLEGDRLEKEIKLFNLKRDNTSDKNQK